MIYAIHSTLNGIIPLLTVRNNVLMVFDDPDLGYKKSQA